MSKKQVAVSVAGAGVAGYLLKALTPSDTKVLLDKLLDLGFKFLSDQGAAFTVSVVIAVSAVYAIVKVIDKLVVGKEKEIERIAKERDKFQKLFIDDWRSSRGRGRGASHD